MPDLWWKSLPRDRAEWGKQPYTFERDLPMDEEPANDRTTG